MRFARLLTCLCCVGLAPAVVAGPLPERFTLAKYVPADVWFYLHNVHNPERAWLDAQWAEVFDALHASGIHDDIGALALSFIPADKRADATDQMAKWTDLLRSVRWADLVAKEVVLAERMSDGLVGVEYLVLARGAPDSAERNMESLVAILQSVSELSEDIKLSQHKIDGMNVWSLKLDSEFGIELFRRGDIIGVVSGEKMFKETRALLSSGQASKSILGSPRLKQAVGELAKPEDSVFFVDAKLIVSKMRDRLANATGEKGAGGPKCGEDDKAALSALGKLLAHFDMIDYSIMTMDYDGNRQTSRQITRLQPGREKCVLACAWLERKPFERFDEFIPVDAKDFSIDGFFDLEHIYKFIIEFINDELPDGPKYIARWDGILANLGFDPNRDLFSWWSGEMVQVTLPAAVVTPSSNTDNVYLFRVKDATLAREKVDSFIDFVSGQFMAHNQMLMVSPAPVNAQGFRYVTHPMAMMIMRPAVGVWGDWLIVGTSAEAINKCIDVSTGKSPSIATNERFKREGLVPRGAVLSASFTDTSRFGQELGAAFGMVGMFGQIGMASIPDEPEVKPIKDTVKTLLGIAMKLSPVVSKIDFYSSEASVVTYDGKLSVHSVKVVTFKTPPSEESRTAGAK